MTQPTPYARSYSFTDFSSGSPNSQPPGSQIDAELDAVSETVGGVLANLARIQRDDGSLANASVGIDQLNASALAILNGGAFVVRGAWATTTAYAVGDIAAAAGVTYLCMEAHTSGTLATDLTAQKMVAIFDPADELVSAALAAVGGAARVGTAGGITVEAALALKATLIDLAATNAAILEKADSAALVGHIASALTRTNAATYPVLDGNVQAVIDECSAAGGGVVLLPRNSIVSVVSLILPDSGLVTLDLNGSTLRCSAATTYFIDGAGTIRNGKIDGQGNCTSFLINAYGRTRLELEALELIGWKAGVRAVATTAPLYMRAHRVLIHLPSGIDLEYPFQVGGGPNYQENAVDIDDLEVIGVGGDYQTNTGTPDQIAIQNATSGRLVNLRSYDGGENGIAISRLSRNLFCDRFVTSGHNGNGVQWGSSAVEMVVADASALVLNTIYAGSVAGTEGEVVYKSGNRIVVGQGGVGTSIIFNVGETFGGTAIQSTIYGGGFAIGNVDAWDNSTGAASFSGLQLQMLRGNPCSWFGRQRAWDTRSPKQQINGLKVSSCAGVPAPVDYDFTGNLTAEQVWQATSDYKVGAEYEWQKSAVAIPALAPGGSVTLTFDGLTGVEATQFIDVTASPSTAVAALTVTACVTVPGRVIVECANTSGAHYAGEASAIFRFKGRAKGAGLSNTSGASVAVGAVKRGAGRLKSVLAADFSVSASTVLADSGLTVAVEANKVYSFRALLFVDAGVTPGYKIAPVLSAAGSGGYTTNRNTAGVAITALATATVGTGSATERIMEVVGRALPTAAGFLKLQFAQNTSDAATCKLLAGSEIELSAA